MEISHTDILAVLVAKDVRIAQLEAELSKLAYVNVANATLANDLANTKALLEAIKAAK